MLDFSQIRANLYLGSAPGNEVDLRQLKLMGVTGTLNLQTDVDFTDWNIDFPALQKTANDLDLVIQRVPVIDFDERDLERRMPVAVRTLQRMLGVGHTVYLHCTAGRERSPSVALAWLSVHGGMSLDQAIEKVTGERACRPNRGVVESFVRTS